MNIAEAKIRFDAGELIEAIVMESLHSSNEYLLGVQRSKGAMMPDIINRQRGGEAYYKTIDAAVAAAKAIGFKNIKIALA